MPRRASAPLMLAMVALVLMGLAGCSKEKATAPVAAAGPPPAPTLEQLKGATVSGFVGRLIRDNLLFDFSVRYVQAHPELAESFVIERPQIEEFRQYLISRNHPFSDHEIESGREVLALRLRAQIARVKWGPSMETRILSEGDPQVQKALTLFEEAARLAKSGEAGCEQRENSRRQAASGPSSSI